MRSWVLYNSWAVPTYNIIVEIEYKYKVEHVLICEIHVNLWWWIVTLWDVKLWTWYLVVNKCVCVCVCVCLTLDVTIIVLWIVNYTITRPVFILRTSQIFNTFYTCTHTHTHTHIHTHTHTHTYTHAHTHTHTHTQSYREQQQCSCRCCFFGFFAWLLFLFSSALLLNRF